MIISKRIFLSNISFSIGMGWYRQQWTLSAETFTLIGTVLLNLRYEKPVDLFDLFSNITLEGKTGASEIIN